MREKILYSPSGKYIKVHDLNGLYLPVGPVDRYQQFRELKELSARHSDVLVCAYPKSGLHWIWEIVNMLLLDTSNITPSLLESNMLEIQTVAKMDQKPSPRVFVTHLKYSQLPHSFREKKCKIVYILRDPRAVTVSYFHHVINLESTTNMTRNEQDWKEFLDMFMNGKVMFGSWFDTVKDWEREICRQQDHPICVTYYENFKEDTLNELQRLAQFLNVDVSKDLCEEIAHNTQIQKLKTSKESIETNFVKLFFKDRTYPMYRKGTIDDWKTTFTVEQNELFQDEFLKRMKGSSIKLKSLL